MDEDKPQPEWVEQGFGLKYAMKEAIEKGSLIVWGARAIWHGRDKGRPDLLPDRQSMVTAEGTDPDEHKERAKIFSKFLNSGVLAEAWDGIPSWLDQSDGDHVILVDNTKVLIECSPNSSYGYLYVCASLKPGISLHRGEVGG